MDLNRILCLAHSGLRWLVVLAALVALVWLIVRLVQNRGYDGATQRVMTIFSSTLGLQWIVGIVFFIAAGLAAGFGVRQRWEHAFVMTIALAVAHMHFPLKRRDDRTRLLGGIGVILVVFALVYVGVAIVPSGWSSTCVSFPAVG